MDVDYKYIVYGPLLYIHSTLSYSVSLNITIKVGYRSV